MQALIDNVQSNVKLSLISDFINITEVCLFRIKPI